MHTKIEIDDDLLSAAMAATGLSTKRATVEQGLRLLARLHCLRLRCQVKALDDLEDLGWAGDLDERREERRSARIALDP